SELAERLDVVGDGQTLLAAGDQGAVHRLGQSLLGAFLGDRDRLKPFVACHGHTGLSLQSRAGGLVSSFKATGPPREWSTRGLGLVRSRASAGAPWPSTHSGSGPSSGRPVKNFAAMQPPRQLSKWLQPEQAPADCGSRSSRNNCEFFQTLSKPPSVNTFPARNRSWMANG